MKDITQPYCNDHKIEFDNFTGCVMSMKIDVLINKISVSSTNTQEKPHLFKSSIIELPIVVRISPLNFLNTFDRNINNEVDQINKIFISNLEDITLFNYMHQPKSLLCKKLLRHFIEEDW